MASRNIWNTYFDNNWEKEERRLEVKSPVLLLDFSFDYIIYLSCNSDITPFPSLNFPIYKTKITTGAVLSSELWSSKEIMYMKALRTLQRIHKCKPPLLIVSSWQSSLFKSTACQLHSVKTSPSTLPWLIWHIKLP